MINGGGINAKRRKTFCSGCIVEGTRAYEIFNYALQGLSIQQIADKIETTEENVRQIIGKQKRQMSLEMQEMQEQWSSITMARTEWLLSKLMPVIEAQSKDGGTPSKDLLKMTLDVFKFQQTIAVPKEQDNSKPDVVINQTFLARGQLYDEALQAMQNEIMGYTVHKVDEPTVIVADEQMTHLQELAEKFLPEGELYDSESDETE